MTEIITDPGYLRNTQYRDSSNLAKRASLHKDFGTNPINWQVWLMDKIDLPGKARVLDLGSGPGYFWQENIKTVPMGWKIYLTDISGGMLEESRAILRGKSQFSYLVVDAQEIPFPDREFDAVLANHMLYHVRDLPRCLSEIRRVLKDGGTFYTATNGPDHLKELRLIERESLGKQHPDTNFWAERFNLANGSGILSKHFNSISKYNYANQLHVTDPEAVIAYLESKSSGGLDPDQSADLLNALKREIRVSGRFEISSEAGLFICEQVKP